MSDDTTAEHERGEGNTSTASASASVSRRGVLKATGVVGITAIASGASLAQMNGGGDGTAIELGGVTAGWEGRAPSSIEGETNPTLELEAGTTYQLTWENVDGAAHNVVINSADGQQLERTEIINQQGATQTLEFTATPEMSEYLCEVHPASMVGGVNVSGAPAGDEADADEPGGDEGNLSEPSNDTDTDGGPGPWEPNDSAAPNGTNISDPGTPTNYDPSNESNVSEPEPGVGAGQPDAGGGNRTENASDQPQSMPDGNETADSDEQPDDTTNMTDAGGNGKAKSGNGKAKSGSGNQMG